MALAVPALPFLQPAVANTIKLAKAATIVIDFILLCFTFTLPARKLAIVPPGAWPRMELSIKKCAP